MRLLFVIISMLLISCGSTQTTTETSNMSEVKKWANDKAFTIESRYAAPLRGSQINIVGNSNFLTVKNDTVSAYLPFFGQRHGGNVLEGGAIEFDGSPKNYQMLYNQKKKSSIIKFEIRERGEHYDVVITLYDNKNSSITVSSSQRDFMRYEGSVSALPDEKD